MRQQIEGTNFYHLFNALGQNVQLQSFRNILAETYVLVGPLMTSGSQFQWLKNFKEAIIQVWSPSHLY